MANQKYTSEEVLKLLESDEPIFILRAKDVFSSATIIKYTEFMIKSGGFTPELEESMHKIIDSFLDWQENNTDQIKFPD